MVLAFNESLNQIYLLPVKMLYKSNIVVINNCTCSGSFSHENMFFLVLLFLYHYHTPSKTLQGIKKMPITAVSLKRNLIHNVVNFLSSFFFFSFCKAASQFASPYFTSPFHFPSRYPTFNLLCD